MYCSFPFEYIRIFPNGEVFFCWWTSDYIIGNIFENSIEEMWRGEKAQAFRKTILDGSYKYCSEFCTLKNSSDTIPSDFRYPKVVDLAYNKFCNVRCKMCRDELICETKEDTEKQEIFIEKVVDICRNALAVTLNCEGEAFASPHFKKLIRILAKTYPNLSFKIFSNGLLLRKDILRDLGIIDRLSFVLVSVHAATKKTYDKIVIGSDFDTVLNNIKYLDKRTRIQLMFVVSSLNYKEMPAFLKMASDFRGIVCFEKFKPCHSSTSTMCREHEKYECFDPKHPEYKNFLKVLRKTVRLAKKNNYKYFFQDAYLLKLAKSVDKDYWWEKIIKSFFKK